MANTLRLVSVALSLGAVLIFLLLMIHTLNKKLKPGDPMCSFLLGSGSSLVLCSVLCRVAQLLL
jgi:hypothetical protein